MAEYLVVFDAAPVAPTDAAVGLKPLASSEIKAPLQTAKIAYVEASSVPNAQEVVRSTYTPQLGVPIFGTTVTGEKPLVIISTQLKES